MYGNLRPFAPTESGLEASFIATFSPGSLRKENPETFCLETHLGEGLALVSGAASFRGHRSISL